MPVVSTFVVVLGIEDMLPLIPMLPFVFVVTEPVALVVEVVPYEVEPPLLVVVPDGMLVPFAFIVPLDVVAVPVVSVEPVVFVPLVVVPLEDDVLVEPPELPVAGTDSPLVDPFGVIIVPPLAPLCPGPADPVFEAVVVVHATGHRSVAPSAAANVTLVSFPFSFESMTHLLLLSCGVFRRFWRSNFRALRLT